MELSEQIAILERALQEHIRRWDRFFAGAEKAMPQIERERIARRIRMLSEQTAHRRAEQFRIEQLQHRFQTYSMNWERMLREREEGRAAAMGPVASQAPPAGAPGAANAAAPQSVNPQEEVSLFDRYRAAKALQGEDVKVDRKTFEEQIEAQRQRIEGRLGQPVRFEVQAGDGQVRVVARKKKKPAS
jgi:hypothetical protein